MTLHRPRGASLTEYALLLFVMIGGAAAAMRETGTSVRDAFEASAVIVGDGAGQSAGGTTGKGKQGTQGGGEGSGGTTGIRIPGGRDGKR
jgi:hypothetical protein